VDVEDCSSTFHPSIAPLLFHSMLSAGCNILSRRVSHFLLHGRPKCNQIGTGVESVKLTDEPLNGVHTVRGSVPICSGTVPITPVQTFTGKVTGMGTVQLFPIAVTDTPVIVVPSGERLYKRLG
jgi:hypothetical protein